MGQNDIILADLGDDIIAVIGEASTGDIHCIGDSITEGFGAATPYPEQLATKLGRTVVNSGIGGQSVQSIIESQLLKTTGSHEFNFRDSFHPWEEFNSTITNSEDRLVLEHNGSATPRAVLTMLEIGEEYTVSGIWAGDATANPVLVDNGFGDRATGTSSTAKQDFTVTFTAASTIMRVDCRTSSIGDKVYVHGLKIDKTDKSACATGDVIFSGGINDIALSVPQDTTFDGYKMIIDSCYQNSLRLIVLLCTPWNASTYVEKSRELDFNDWLVQNVKTPIVDPTSLGDSDYSQTANTLDGLHFDTTGNGLLADEVVSQIYTSGYSGNTYRSADLSQWFLKNGYLRKKDGTGWAIPDRTATSSFVLFESPVDPSATRVYFGAMGNGAALIASAVSMERGEVVATNASFNWIAPFNGTDYAILRQAVAGGAIVATYGGSYTTRSGWVDYK